MRRDEIREEDGANHEKMAISKAEWNEFFRETNDEEEFVAYDTHV